MIKYTTTNAGDLLRIVGAGAPDYAEIDDIVEVTKCNHVDTLYVKNADDEEVYFRGTCGAARLEHVLELPMRVARAGYAADLKAHDDDELTTEAERAAETIDTETSWLEAVTAEREYRAALAARTPKEQTDEQA